MDDGSIDNSVNVVKSFADSRIKLIRGEHNYIASLNHLIDLAQGKYIAKMDADDIMCEHRLSVQYDFMEQHSEIEVVGGSLWTFRDNDVENLQPADVKGGLLCLSDMIDGCCVCHPTVMFRRASLEAHKEIRYKESYIYAEDYALWVDMLAAGMKIYNLQTPLVKYRVHGNQVSSRHSAFQQQVAAKIQRNAMKSLVKELDRAVKEKVSIPMTTNELTIVIPFFNEKDEVHNTVKSIRETVGDRVDIIVVNDASDDEYDYLSDVLPYNVHYVRNRYRIGAALTNDCPNNGCSPTASTTATATGTATSALGGFSF